ncbi:accessory colonization factor AcfC [Vibrio cholerae]|nr:accessory colonization factor AcfC [Vibrio cholerae]
MPLIKVAESFEKSQSKRVNITFGPQATWNDKEKKMLIFYSVHQNILL